MATTASPNTPPHSATERLLVTSIDELGYLPFEANAAHLFFQLVSRRYERGSTTSSLGLVKCSSFSSSRPSTCALASCVTSEVAGTNSVE